MSRRLTEFEQAVAEALDTVLSNVGMEVMDWDAPDSDRADRWPEYLARKLAPRVAAAIEAAGRYNPYSKNRDDVLAALRGPASRND